MEPRPRKTDKLKRRASWHEWTSKFPFSQAIDELVSLMESEPSATESFKRGGFSKRDAEMMKIILTRWHKCPGDAISLQRDHSRRCQTEEGNCGRGCKYTLVCEPFWASLTKLGPAA